jgi:hypothetical protein
MRLEAMSWGCGPVRAMRYRGCKGYEGLKRLLEAMRLGLTRSRGYEAMRPVRNMSWGWGYGAMRPAQGL